MQIWVAVATLLLGSSMAQTISPANWTAADANEVKDNSIGMNVAMDNDMVPLAAVLNLTAKAGYGIPTPGLSGKVFLANESNQLSLRRDDIAVITCDASAYPGNMNALDVFSSAEAVNVSSIVWYSQHSDYCALNGYSGSYPWIYTMKSVNDTLRMLSNIKTLSEDGSAPVYLTIGSPDVASQSSNSTNGTTSGSSGSSGSQSSQQTGNPLGPSPSTAVAMIILYSITGIITALFLVIIITGAIRAHRHPDRYGPRNVMGRPRQSRARGLARAMLETIPIVKFGEREEPKPTEVELGDAEPPQSDSTALPNDETQEERHFTRAAPIMPGPEDRVEALAATAERRNSADDRGIAAATPLPTHRDGEASDSSENQGCSICAEDFEIGQDQRVLPCNHRFHPACIDPWLLNVSGTCPLCRIDLRPQAADPQLDEDGNPIQSDGEAPIEPMAPPLAPEGDTSRRLGVRRSIVAGLAGIGRADRMSREERVIALREYQSHIDAHRRRQEREGIVEEASQEEESGLRTRLRNAFRIRTRRTGLASSQENVAGLSGIENGSAENDHSQERHQGMADRPSAAQ